MADSTPGVVLADFVCVADITALIESELGPGACVHAPFPEAAQRALREWATKHLRFRRVEKHD